MSQHDFEIANQGFPSFRSDLNSGLQALASNSAGATEPSTTYAYQMWYDSTANLLKMRNTDNDAWITLAYFDQTNDEWEVRSAVIQAVDAAGVTIKDDSGTTLLAVADGGGVTITDNASNGGLSVEGTSSPRVVVEDTTNNAQAFLEAGDSITRVGSVSNHSLELRTNNTERMRIDTNGHVGIGVQPETINTFNALRIGSGALLAGHPSLHRFYIGANAYYNSGYRYIANDEANLIDSFDGTIRFQTASAGSADSTISFSEIIRMNSSGISFDGGSNYLDDYEEGQFNPTFSSGLSSVSYSANVAYYTKIGNRVFFDMRFTVSSATRTASILTIDGLPFTSQQRGGAYLAYANSSVTSSTTQNINFFIPASNDIIEFYSGAAGLNGTDLAAGNISIFLHGMYITAS